MLPPNTPVQRVEHPELRESFCDSLGTALFDGQTIRIELCIQRLDPPESGRPPSATQHPVCRLVLPPDAAVDLYNRLAQIVSILEQKGLVTRDAGTPKVIN